MSLDPCQACGISHKEDTQRHLKVSSSTRPFIKSIHTDVRLYRNISLGLKFFIKDGKNFAIPKPDGFSQVESS